MANNDLLTALLSVPTLETWEKNCMLSLNSSTGYNWTGLVNETGGLMSSLTADTWGITVEICRQYCGASAVPFVSSI